MRKRISYREAGRNEKQGDSMFYPIVTKKVYQPFNLCPSLKGFLWFNLSGEVNSKTRMNYLIGTDTFGQCSYGSSPQGIRPFTSRM